MLESNGENKAKISKLQREFQWFIYLCFPGLCTVIVFVHSAYSLQILRLQHGENIDGLRNKLQHIIKVKVVLLSIRHLRLHEALTFFYNTSHWLWLWTCGWKLPSLFCFPLSLKWGRRVGRRGAKEMWGEWGNSQYLNHMEQVFLFFACVLQQILHMSIHRSYINCIHS